VITIKMHEVKFPEPAMKWNHFSAPNHFNSGRFTRSYVFKHENACVFATLLHFSCFSDSRLCI